MSYLLIKNAKAIFDTGIFERDILIKDNKIVDTAFFGELPNDCEIYDAKNNFVSAGFIDIHLHGGGGFDFMDSTEETFKAISEVHLKNGSTTIIPTTV